MKAFTSIVALAMAVASVGAVVIEPRCVPDNNDCKSDGSMGTCCSNFCLSEGGAVGKCTAPPQNAKLVARCIADNGDCKADGSMGACCSNFCLSEGGVGKCTAPPKLAARCIADNGDCKADGSMGTCCSNFCLSEGGQVGKCTAAPKQT